jgi:hypothetical protein
MHERGMSGAKLETISGRSGTDGCGGPGIGEPLGGRKYMSRHTVRQTSVNI